MRCRALALGVVVVLGASAAEARYFGRNKVRYEDFDFQVLRTGHFDVLYYPEEEKAARIVGRLAERWHQRLSLVLGHQLRGRQPIILYAGHPDFQQTNAVPGRIHESTGGVTEGLKRRVVLPAAGPLRDTDHVLGHELVHAFQFDAVDAGRRARLDLPLWFVEGMAEYLSLGPVDPHTAMWMRDAARSDRLPDVRDLHHPRYFPYRYGHSLWSYVAGRWGDEAVGRALRAAASSRDGAVRCLEKVLEVSADELTRGWHEALQAAYGRPGSSPALPGRALVAGDEEGALNLGPALSPDGRRLVFLSERKEGTLELFLSDADSGRVERRLVKRRLDEHFDSLQFVHSAGAWDAGGRRFAFAAVRDGEAVISVFDVGRGVMERALHPPRIEEALTPTWSPDGRRIAFVGIHGGLTDLFVLDLESGALEALTSDSFAELHPAWSPDGASIAFATDRFSSDLESLDWGRYRLARLNLPARTVEPLPSFPGVDNYNPQWGSNGRVLYFLSDRGGGKGIYRLEPATGSLRQVTGAEAGVSGLTALSPALASAAGGERLVASVWRHGRYQVRSIDDPAVLAGRELSAEEGADPAPLPPADGASDTVPALLADARRGLPDGSAFETRPYRAQLAFDHLSQPYFNFGSDRFGLFFAGGASLFWSDMLGNRRLGTALEVRGSLKDLAAAVAYQDLEGRWAWGLAAEQLPFRRSSFSSGIAELDGRAVSVEQAVRVRETDRRVAGSLGYPIARSDRLELSLGYRSASFSTEVEMRTLSLEDGKQLGETRRTLPSAPPLHLLELGAAFVHDSARFGATGPVRGQRHRLEVTPTLGSRSFAAVLADLRRYEMPVYPLTLAGRLVHFGRYGGDAEHRSLAPLFVGSQAFVRGYDVDAFDAGRCRPGACPAIDGLVGSRLLALNLEARVPAFFLLSRERPYGPVPLEAALFFDAGIAWTSRDRPSFLGGVREPVRSWGAALRFNLFGFAIGEVAYVRPLDLPGKTSLWRLRLTPGF